jgi:hypothetical protein
MLPVKVTASVVILIMMVCAVSLCLTLMNSTSNVEVMLGVAGLILIANVVYQFVLLFKNRLMPEKPKEVA